MRHGGRTLLGGIGGGAAQVSASLRASPTAAALHARRPLANATGRDGRRRCRGGIGRRLAAELSGIPSPACGPARRGRHAPALSDQPGVLQCLAAWNDPGSGLAARGGAAATRTAMARTASASTTTARAAAAAGTWAAEAGLGDPKSATATGRALAAWPMCSPANRRCAYRPFRRRSSADERCCCLCAPACPAWRMALRRRKAVVLRVVACGPAAKL